MAIIADPRKVFNFQLDISGFDAPVSVQKISGLSVEIDEVAHSEGNSDVYTAGRVKYTPLTLERIQSALGVEKFFQKWLESASYGVGGSYKKTMTIRQLGSDGITTIQTWVIKGAWVKKIDDAEFNRTSSDNSMQKIEIRYDERIDL